MNQGDVQKVKTEYYILQRLIRKAEKELQSLKNEIEAQKISLEKILHDDDCACRREYECDCGKK